jgi:hypothetical protein
LRFGTQWTLNGAGKTGRAGWQDEVAMPLSVLYIQNSKIAMSDQDIQQLESQFPAVSGSAFAAAREQTLASGQSVLQSEDGVIYEVFPDGRKVMVKKIEPPIQVVAGSIFTIR